MATRSGMRRRSRLLPDATRRPALGPFSGDVEVEYRGRTYRGTWSVQRGVLTVTSEHDGPDSTPLRTLDPRLLAKAMLLQLVRSRLRIAPSPA